MLYWSTLRKSPDNVIAGCFYIYFYSHKGKSYIGNLNTRLFKDYFNHAYLLNGFIHALRVQHQTDGQQVVHLLCLLVDLVVLVRARREQLLGTLHVQQSRGQSADSVCVPTHHHVREAHVVRGGDLACWHMGVLGLFVQLNVFEHL